MNKGEIVQQGSPQVLYRQPQNAFMAKFMGEVNLLLAEKQGNQLRIGECLLVVDEAQFPQADGLYILGIRPEAVKLSQDLTNAEHIGEVHNAVYMGGYWELQILWQNQPLTVYADIAEYDENIKQYGLIFQREGMFLVRES